jgi:hypothetical protein
MLTQCNEHTVLGVLAEKVWFWTPSRLDTVRLACVERAFDRGIQPERLSEPASDLSCLGPMYQVQRWRIRNWLDEPCCRVGSLWLAHSWML